MEILKYPVSELAEIYAATTQEAELFKNKTVLILGGSGFLGSAIKAYFMYLNKEVFDACNRCFVISVDNYVGREKQVEDAGDNILHIEHDLATPIDDKLPSCKIDFIINASGNASPSNYAVHSLETIDISVNAVRYLLRLAKIHKASILNFSSSEVLGTPSEENVPTDEEYIPRVHTMNPRACYDVGKMMLETLSWIYSTKHRVDVKVVRLFNCVGRFRQDDFRVFPNFMLAALKRKEIPVFAPGTQTRTFSYYTDVIAGCIKVLTRGKSLLYHIGNSNNEISMLDFAKMIERISGNANLVSLQPTPDVYKHEPLRRCPSIQKAVAELGYCPTIGIEEMTRRVFEWSKENYTY